jgi:hypothetical protein
MPHPDPKGTSFGLTKRLRFLGSLSSRLDFCPSPYRYSSSSSILALTADLSILLQNLLHIYTSALYTGTYSNEESYLKIVCNENQGSRRWHPFNIGLRSWRSWFVCCLILLSSLI